MVVSNGNLDIIEAYFSGILNVQEKLNVEQKIKADSTFAQDVSFYLQAKEVAKQAAHEARKLEWESIRKQKEQESGRVIKFRTVLRSAAACVLVAFSCLFWFDNSSNPNNMADNYIEQNLNTLSVSMTNIQDSLELGASLYNQKKYTQAVQVFEAVRVKKEQEEIQALTYTGLSYLQLKQYDKALLAFQKMSANKQITANKGKFYQALTLMKRNEKDDKANAIALLNEIVKLNLGGKKEAIDWLKKI